MSTTRYYRFSERALSQLQGFSAKHLRTALKSPVADESRPESVYLLYGTDNKVVQTIIEVRNEAADPVARFGVSHDAVAQGLNSARQMCGPNMILLGVLHTHEMPNEWMPSPEDIKKAKHKSYLFGVIGSHDQTVCFYSGSGTQFTYSLAKGDVRAMYPDGSYFMIQPLNEHHFIQTSLRKETTR